MMKKHNIKLIIIPIIIAIILFSFLTYFFFRYEFIIEDFNYNIEVPVKEKFNYRPIVYYGNRFHKHKTKVITNRSIDINKIGKQNIIYNFSYKKHNISLETVINFTDKVKPVINVNDGFSVCPNGDIKDLKYSAFDNYDLDITNNVKVNYSDNYIILTVSDSSNNKTIKNVKSIKDNISPVITINGDTNITISKGTEYIDKGASAIDNCDGDVAVVTSSNVDTNSVGSYKITYTATDKSGNSSSLERVVNVKEVNRGDRIIYLTFDDGPGKFTSKLLDVLNKYNVKATFFVTGKGEDSLIKREYEEGHSIGLHSYSHDYSYIYSSVDNYFNDLNRVSDRVYNITGYRTNLIRFPGGASNTISRHYDNGTHIMSTLTRLVLEKGYQYYDWNISSGDAGETTDTNTVYSNVINKLKEGSSVILQHDIKGFSVDAVEKIINYGLSNGYTFRGLDINSYNAHQRVNN